MSCNGLQTPRHKLSQPCQFPLCHNYVMSVRTTIDIPEDLYEVLRRRAASEQTSIRSLVIGAMERKFGGRRRTPVLQPPVPGTGKPGPLCPDKENPYDVLFG